MSKKKFGFLVELKMSENFDDIDIETFDYSQLDLEDIIEQKQAHAKQIKKHKVSQLNKITAKTLSNNLNAQSQFDPSIDIFFLDSPATSVNDISLCQYDDEFVQANNHEIYEEDDILPMEDDYDAQDFIDPNAEYIAMGLTPSQLNEKFEAIEVKTLAMVKLMDLRMYKKSRRELKRSIVSDMMHIFFGECHYVSRQTQLRVASIVSGIVDHEINDLISVAGKRNLMLFGSLKKQIEPFVQQYINASNKMNEIQKKRYVEYLLTLIKNRFIVNEARAKQYAPTEYDFVVEQTRNYLQSMMK